MSVDQANALQNNPLFQPGQELMLTPGTRRLQHGNQSIWGNLLNGQWIKVPQITDQFIDACLEAELRECIVNFASESGLDPEVLKSLLEYLIEAGFLKVKRSPLTEIDGVELVNDIGLERPEQTEIKEVFAFKKGYLCFKDSSGQGASLSEERWDNLIGRLKDAQIKELALMVYADSDYDLAATVIRLARPYFGNLELNFVTGLDAGLIPRLVEALMPDRDRIIFYGGTGSEVKGLDWRASFIATIQNLKSRGFNVACNCSFDLEPQILSALYDCCTELDLPLGMGLCAIRQETGQPGAVSNATITQTWREVLTRHSRAGSKNAFYWGQEYFTRFKLSCGAGRKIVAFSQSGVGYPCPALMVKDCELGQVWKDGIAGMERKAAVLLANSGVEKRTVCRNCFMAYFCGGGCPARAYRTIADLEKPDAICGFIQKGPALIPWQFDFSASVKENLDRIAVAVER